MKRSPVVLACISLLLALLVGTGCSTLQSNQTTSADALAEPDTTTATASADTVEETPPTLAPEVAALYNLEARIVAATDRQEKAALLDEAMTKLVTLLEEDEVRLQNPNVRAVHRGLLAEYRRFHGYAPSDTLDVAQGSIFAIRSALFAAINAVDDPLLEDVMPAPDAERPSTSVPLTTNRAVKRSIAYLQEAPDKHVDRWLQRAQTYFPMIEHILNEENVPDELKHLAMVESGLNPQARSWAGAVGMWQFMRGTGRAYDLTVNAWVDERRDPEKATRAAARHLRDLYDDFNDWHLALAAYNCGAGCVKRAQRRSGGGTASYWDIYDHLPRETRGYVPMFIAATLVASDPDAYGFTEAPSGPAYSYDYVAVRGSMLSLNELADLAGTEISVLRALNPELRRGAVPPSKGYYHLRIPLGQYEPFMRRYAALPDAKKRPATTYRVRSGDTLSELAARYGTSTRRLQRLNGIRGTTIRVGQELVVPVADYESAFTADADDARPLRVQYGATYPVQPIPSAIAASSEADDASPFRNASLAENNASTGAEDAPTSDESPAASAEAAPPSEAGASESQPSETTAAPATYRVRQGDTLSEIAERFDVSLSDMRRWNGLMSSRIYVGQELRLQPGDEPVDAEPMTYRVRRGDTLSEIAERFGTSPRALRSTNNLQGSRIRIGQTLKVPSAGSSKQTYRVQRGDTLGKIARRYGVSIQQVMAWNNLNRSTIYPGQELVIVQ